MVVGPPNKDFPEQISSELTVDRPEGQTMSTPVDLNGPIDKRVEALLHNSLSHAFRISEDLVGAYLDQQRHKFDCLFDGTEFEKDPRVKKLARVYDYSSRVQFDWEKFYAAKRPNRKKPEEAVRMFRNFFRLTAIEICQELRDPMLVTKLKISGVCDLGDDRMREATRALVEQVNFATRGRINEIYAALVLFRTGIIDP